MTAVLTSLGIQSAQEKQEEKLEAERQERVARKKQEDAAAVTTIADASSPALSRHPRTPRLPLRIRR